MKFRSRSNPSSSKSRDSSSDTQASTGSTSMANLLDTAAGRYQGDIFAIIHSDNGLSQRVITKVGFEFLRVVRIDGQRRHLYRRHFAVGAERS
jgi:hypothetical protein